MVVATVTWGARLGRLDFLRQRGLPWIEMLRGWLLVAMGASATGRFVFDLDRTWALALLIVVPIAGETCALLLGLWMARTGMIQAHYQTAAQLDPYRSEHLALLREIRALLMSQGSAAPGAPPRSAPASR